MTVIRLYSLTNSNIDDTTVIDVNYEDHLVG